MIVLRLPALALTRAYLPRGVWLWIGARPVESFLIMHGDGPDEVVASTFTCPGAAAPSLVGMSMVLGALDVQMKKKEHAYTGTRRSARDHPRAAVRGLGRLRRTRGESGADTRVTASPVLVADCVAKTFRGRGLLSASTRQRLLPANHVVWLPTSHIAASRRSPPSR